MHKTLTRAFAAAFVLSGAAAFALDDAPLALKLPSLGDSLAMQTDDYGEPGIDDFDEEQTDFDEEETEVTTEEVAFEEDKDADKGLYALIGAGGELYTGDLGDTLNLGPSATAIVGYQAPVFGVEGSFNAGGAEVDVGDGGIGDGLDIRRNSVQAAVTAGLTSTGIQPYLLGGAGVDWFNVEDPTAPGAPGAQFEDASNVYIPAGAGLRYVAGKVFTIDARYTYDFMLGEDFALGDIEGAPADGDRMQAVLSLGGTF